MRCGPSAGGSRPWPPGPGSLEAIARFPTSIVPHTGVLVAWAREAEEGPLRVECAEGFPDPGLTGADVFLDSSLVGWVHRKERILYLADLESRRRRTPLVHGDEARLPIRSFLGAPLRVGGPGRGSPRLHGRGADGLSAADERCPGDRRRRAGRLAGQRRARRRSPGAGGGHAGRGRRLRPLPRGRGGLAAGGPDGGAHRPRSGRPAEEEPRVRLRRREPAAGGGHGDRGPAAGPRSPDRPP